MLCIIIFVMIFPVVGVYILYHHTDFGIRNKLKNHSIKRSDFNIFTLCKGFGLGSNNSLQNPLQIIYFLFLLGTLHPDVYHLFKRCISQIPSEKKSQAVFNLSLQHWVFYF